MGAGAYRSDKSLNANSPDLVESPLGCDWAEIGRVSGALEQAVARIRHPTPAECPLPEGSRGNHLVRVRQ